MKSKANGPKDGCKQPQCSASENGSVLPDDGKNPSSVKAKTGRGRGGPSHSQSGASRGKGGKGGARRGAPPDHKKLWNNKSSKNESSETEFKDKPENDVSLMGLTDSSDDNSDCSEVSAKRRHKARKTAQALKAAFPKIASEVKFTAVVDGSEAKPKKPQILVILADESGRVHGAVNKDRNFVVNRGGMKWFDVVTGRQHQVVYSNAMTDSIKGKQLSIGHYEIDEEQPEVELMCSIGPERIKSFKIDKTEFKQRNVLVAYPVVNSLKNKFPNPYLSESNLNAFQALVVREYPSLPITLLVDSIEYYCSEVFLVREALRTDNMVSMINHVAKTRSPDERTHVQPSSVETQEYVLGLGLPVDHGAFYRMNASSPTPVWNNTDNGNWEIMESKGFNFRSKEDPSITGIAGCFTTTSNEHPKLYKTVYFRLCDENKDFQVLDKDGIQFSHALCRMYKARTNEADLRLNQLKILGAFPVDDDLLSWCTSQEVQPIRDLITANKDIIQGGFEGKEQLYSEELTGPDILARRAVSKFHQDLISSKAMSWSETFNNWPFLLLYAVASALLWIMGKLDPLKRIRRPTKAALYEKWCTVKIAKYGEVHKWSGVEESPPEAKFKNEFAKPTDRKSVV